MVKMYTDSNRSLRETEDFGIGGATSEDEIDLLEVWLSLWRSKWIILSICLIFTFSGIAFALFQPNQYSSSTVLAPTKGGVNGLSGLASQYGGLAAMAGISLGGSEGNDIDQAVELMNSWAFWDEVIRKNGLKAELTAAKGWSESTGRIEYDQSIYDPVATKWKTIKGKSSEPSSFQVYKRIQKMVNVSLDNKSGMLHVSAEHYSPLFAQALVKLTVAEINIHFKARDILDANKNILYLKKKIAQTNLADMQAVFYEMIESQTKTLMLAEVGDEYLIKTVVPAMAAEDKSRPKRLLIVILAAMLGAVISVVVVLARTLVEKDRGF